jgi:hypothetical protein
MASLVLLWLPIVVSAVLVFVVSAASHMFAPARRNEWSKVPGEAAIQEGLRGAAPGLYVFPVPDSPADRGKPEALQRWAQGPSGWISLVPPGPLNMGRNLGLSLLVNLLVSALVAYLAVHALGVAPHGRSIFRLAGLVVTVAYAIGPLYEAIWYWKPWRSLAMTLVESLLYGLVTAATFAHLWPR